MKVTQLKRDISASSWQNNFLPGTTTRRKVLIVIILHWLRSVTVASTEPSVQSFMLFLKRKFKEEKNKIICKVNKYPRHPWLHLFLFSETSISKKDRQHCHLFACLKKTKQKPKVQVLLTDYLINYLDASQQNSFISRQVTFIYFYK